MQLTLSPFLRHGYTKRKKGGALLTYVANKLATGLVQLEKLNTLNGDLESQWIEIERDNAKNIIISNIYRPPAGQLKNTLTLLNKNISTFNLSEKEIFLLGDFNVNYKNKSSPKYKKLFFFQKAKNLSQLIKTDTRITKNSSTILNLILTKASYIRHSGTLDTFISDHQPIFLLKKKESTQSL